TGKACSATPRRTDIGSVRSSTCWPPPGPKSEPSQETTKSAGFNAPVLVPESEISWRVGSPGRHNRPGDTPSGRQLCHQANAERYQRLAAPVRLRSGRTCTPRDAAGSGGHETYGKRSRPRRTRAVGRGG